MDRRIGWLEQRTKETEMPVQRCQSGGKPGWKWGKHGRCYTYKRGDSAGSASAKAKAVKQGRAAKAGDAKK